FLDHAFDENRSIGGCASAGAADGIVIGGHGIARNLWIGTRYSLLQLNPPDEVNDFARVQLLAVFFGKRSADQFHDLDLDALASGFTEWIVFARTDRVDIGVQLERVKWRDHIQILIRNGSEAGDDPQEWLGL